MKNLDQLLAEWEDGTLTAEDAAQLKQALASPSARAELVGDWLLHEAIYGSLRAEQTQTAPVAGVVQEVEEKPAARPSPDEPAEPAWWRQWLPHSIWREARLSLRWAAGAATAACLLLLGAYFFFQNAPVAQLARLQGQVVIERGQKKLALHAGQWLYPGDILRTSADGSAVLTWKNEATRCELGASTEFEILGQMRGKSFRLQSGKLQAVVARQSRLRPLTVTTPQAEARVVGTRLALEAKPVATRLEVTQGAVALRKTRLASAADKDTVTVRSGEFVVASPETELKVQFITGCAAREVLEFPAGTALFATSGGSVVTGDLVTNLTVFANSSDMARAPAKRYEQRLRCFITAPATGDYRFWIYSGQRSELWLSTDGDPAHVKRIALVSLPPARAGNASAQPAPPSSPATRLTSEPIRGNFAQPPEQKSAPQRFTEGVRYYLEVRHEYEPGALVTVGWTKPGQPHLAPSGVPGGEVLTPFFEGTPLPGVASNR